MARVSPNCIFGCAGLVVSLAFIGFSVWLHFSDIPTLCVKVLEKPSLILGLIVLISLGFGLIVAFYPVKFIFWISKISYCLILLGLLYFAVFSILVTNRNVSRALFGRDGNYSDYLLEKYVMNAEQIKSCLVDFQVCPNIPTAKGAEFYKYCLSPAQLSCCILPAQCTLVLQNDTYWIMPKAGPAVANNDGKNWSTVESELCFNCQSCKTASYNIIKKHWKITSFITLFIVFVCCVDFCALKFKNSHRVFNLAQFQPQRYTLPESVAEAFTDTGSMSPGCFDFGIGWILVPSLVCPLDIFVFVVFAHCGVALFHVKYVVNEENWEEIKSCLVDTKFCQSIPTGKGADFYKYRLSHIQSSCCKPPTYCGLEFHNATYWTMPKAGPAVADDDCKIWSNVQSELCFNCQSCKTSFLDHIKRDWKTCSLVNLGLLLLVLFVYGVGCCAFRNTKSKGK
ncbi:hypothetical protein KY285_017704 [Solanum tuberosum]|nr:hypothetical protein KY289_017870 [Solanum tuberosum]KAH0703426.1 hypothetical protein KY285_017704 [Solanum tuberosum]